VYERVLCSVLPREHSQGSPTYLIMRYEICAQSSEPSFFGVSFSGF